MRPPLGATVRVWSLAVRAAHWALAACVLACLWLHHGGRWHELLGYAALALGTWRVAHGFTTRDGHARFGGFVRGPRATLGYVRALLTRRAPRHLGHNPLGAWMILALLAAVLAAGATGALYVTDRFWGDERVATLHEVTGWSLALLVPLHLMGVVVSSLTQGENLVLAMLNGDKPAPPQRASDAKARR